MCVNDFLQMLTAKLKILKSIYNALKKLKILFIIFKKQNVKIRIDIIVIYFYLRLINSLIP